MERSANTLHAVPGAGNAGRFAFAVSIKLAVLFFRLINMLDALAADGTTA